MTFSLLTADELRSEPPPVDWIVKGLVARGHLTLLAGEGGLGKSSFTLALCAAVRNSSTHYYGGFPVTVGPIAYVDGENSRGEIHRRANAFGIFEWIYQFEGDMAQSRAELADVAAKVPNGLVVLDSFRSLFPSVDENSTKDVMPVLKIVQLIARVYDVGIVILHHTSKSGIYRGSTSFRDTPDVVCTLKRDNGPGARYIDWNKMRIGIEPDRHFLRISQQNGAMHWEQSHSTWPKGQSCDLDEAWS